MKFKDGKKGMRVKALTNSSMYEKGDILTISGFIYNSKFIFEEIGCNHQPCKFKPVEQFIYNDNFGKYKARVLIRVKEPTTGAKTVGIRYKNRNGKMANKFVNPLKLETPKKPDELEVGDKFRQKGKAEHEVIGVHYDEERESKIYVVRLLDGKIKGAVDLVFPETITEIVYE